MKQLLNNGIRGWQFKILLILPFTFFINCKPKLSKVPFEKFAQYPDDYFRELYGLEIKRIYRSSNLSYIDCYTNTSLRDETCEHVQFTLKNDTLIYLDSIKVVISNENECIDSEQSDTCWNLFGQLSCEMLRNGFLSIITIHPDRYSGGNFILITLNEEEGDLLFLPNGGYVTDEKISYVNHFLGYPIENSISYKERIKKGIKLRNKLYYIPK